MSPPKSSLCYVLLLPQCNEKKNLMQAQKHDSNEPIGSCAGALRGYCTLVRLFLSSLPEIIPCI